MNRKPGWWIVNLMLLLSGLFVACAFCGGAEGDGVPISALPAAPMLSAELRSRLAQALKAKGRSYVPRTRHLREDGSPQYTNRLILESSPYLLQHSHNPVNWYPWGAEALADAERLGRPVLLSIGYSTCHWCHVMEEESFEDEEIAAFINANYIPIKVDREERPDLDAIYMSAVQMMTGRGGWPMTTWLTPDGRPFFGGTYFPPRDGDRGAQTGFLTLLRQLKQAYDEQPDRIASQAELIVRRIEQAMAPQAGGKALPGAESLETAARSYESNFDDTDGGLRQQPKFPSSLPIRLLLAEHRRTGSARLLQMASLTLSRMAGGGMYDQIGGGFHRYSVDSKWLVPHFEKMLYDNALLTVAYLEGYQASGNDEFARVAREILDYVAREMTATGGAFYSATDADSLNPHGEMEEGWFFTWTPEEIDSVVGAEEGKRFQAYYGVTSGGNFEGRTILNVARPLVEVARLLGLAPEKLSRSLADSRGKLYDARAKRPAPLRDDKILTAWNGLMISAMARGGFVLDEPDFVERAERAAEFVLENLRVDGRLRRSFMDGRAPYDGYLDDYAFLTAALLDLYETTHGWRWLEQAIALQRLLDEHYADEDNGGYFMTSDDHEALLAREKPTYDGAEPSGNSVALMNLLRLHELTSDDAYRATADRLLTGFERAIRNGPTGLSEMLLGLAFRLGSPREIVIVTAGPSSEAAPFLDVLRKTFVPAKVVAVVAEGRDSERQGRLVPLVKGKLAREGRPTAYVCESGVCRLPTTDVDVFARQLEPAEAGKDLSGPSR